MNAPPVPSSSSSDVPMKTYNTRFRKALMHKIGTLGTAAHEEIFRMLKADNVNHTRNKYGIHINLSSVDDELIGKICNFVDYCICKDKDLKEYNQKLEEYRVNKRFDALPMPNASAAQGGGWDGAPAPVAASTSNDADDIYQLQSPKGGCSSFLVTFQERQPPDGENAPDAESVSQCNKEREQDINAKNPLEKWDRDMQNLRKSMYQDHEIPQRRKSVNTKFNSAKKKYSRKKHTSLIFDRHGSMSMRPTPPQQGASHSAAAGSPESICDQLDFEPYLINHKDNSP